MKYTVMNIVSQKKKCEKKFDRGSNFSLSSSSSSVFAIKTQYQMQSRCQEQTKVGEGDIPTEKKPKKLIKIL